MVRAQLWYAASIAALASAYVAVPVARSGVAVAIAIVCVSAIEFGVQRLRPKRAGAWRLLEAAVAVLGLHVVLVLRDGTSTVAPAYPAGSDLVAMAGFVVLSVALFWLGRPVPPDRDGTSLVDAIILTLAASLVVWVALVNPVMQSRSLSVAEQVPAIIAVVGYIAVFAAGLRLLLGWRRNTAVIALAVASVCLVVAEPFHRHVDVLTPSAGDGRLVDLGYVALAAGCGVAALSPSMRDVASPESSRHSLRPWRIAMIATGLLVAPAVLLFEPSEGPLAKRLAIAVGGTLVSVLVVARLSMTGQAFRAGAAREHASGIASQAMVSAVNVADVVAGTRNALDSLVPAHGEISVDLIDTRDSTREPGVVKRVGRGPRAEVAIPLKNSESALVFTAPARVLTDVIDLLGSLADQAAVAMQRINLAAIASAEERDRYFRTVVLTSTDAILITRDGHIEYASPSAQTMFGRDVVDESFDELVHPVDHRGAHYPWPKSIDGAEGIISRPGGDATVVIQRRDLTEDPTVRGTVTTLRDVTDERNLQRELAYRASHDELTGMVNTRAWSEVVSSEKDRRRGPGNGVGVIFIDLDDFKQINDRYGHPMGDRVLANVAERISRCVRAGDVAARVGGDEFAVLLRGLPDRQDARAAAQRLADTLAQPAVVDSTTIECQASIGLSYTEGQERIDTLIHQADTALYAAKEQGKGHWTEYNPKQWAPRRMTHNGGLTA